MESDTPRTDANVWVTRVEVDDPELGLVVVEEHVVDADFARQLERELAAALRRIEELEAPIRNPLSRALELEKALRHMKQRGGGA